MRRGITYIFFTLTLLLALSLIPAIAQDFDAVEIKATPVAGSVHVLTGKGGNIAICAGSDGIFMVDDQFGPLSDKIRAAVASVSAGSIKFLLNTHWHGDHTGGNENFGATGSILVAHENVRNRLSTEQARGATKIPPLSRVGLPVVTFSEDVSFHYNDETIEIFHVANAHTDGDGIVQFKESNVIHMGDTFFAGTYPFIDVSTGGSIDGLIDAADSVLSLIDDNTKIIPGHGPVAGKTELIQYRAMLQELRDNVSALINAGKSRDQVIAAKPTKKYDHLAGFIQPDRLAGAIYDSLTNSN